MWSIKGSIYNLVFETFSARFKDSESLYLKSYMLRII